MRHLKFLAFAAASAIILTGCSSPLDMTTIEEPKKPITNDIPEMTITGEEMAQNIWYHELCGGLQQYKTTCVVSERISNRDVKNAIAHLPDDHPEIFWLGNTYSAVTVTDGSKVEFSLLDGLNEEDIPAMAQELEDEANNIIAQVPEGSDYDKVLFIHDYLAEHTIYDHSGANSSKAALCHTSYGCIVKGLAVCEGYAEAFTLLMNKLGIESGICTGSNHSWNYVKINEKYYWVDVTWDDLDIIANGYQAEHCYFLVNSDMILRSRELDWTQGYFPDCSSIDENYFVKNGSYFTEYDRDTIISYIDAQSDKPNCEMMFADYDSYKEALDDLIGKSKIFKASSINRDTMTYYRGDNMYYLNINY